MVDLNTKQGARETRSVRHITEAPPEWLMT
jgi:hypothetical protein